MFLCKHTINAGYDKWALNMDGWVDGFLRKTMFLLVIYLYTLVSSIKHNLTC